MLGMSAPPEHVPSVNRAYARLGRVIAQDRFNTCPSRLTGRDRVWLMLEYLEPKLVLEKFVSVQPMPNNAGDRIKWRKMVPFEANVK